MDNFRIDITAEGDKLLADAMLLAFSKHNGASHYAVREAFAGEADETAKWKYGCEPKPLRLVFYWADSQPQDLQALPFKLDAEGAADFARRWLAETDYGPEPDHDGHNGKGWRLYNGAWGHVDDHWGAVIAVTPVWAMYGK